MNKYTESVTYWTKGSLDKYGEPTWSGPNQTQARWEAISELFITTDGERASSTARIYLEPKVNIGDYVYRGKSSSSTPPNDAYIVKQFQEVRNVKGTKRERKLIL